MSFEMQGVSHDLDNERDGQTLLNGLLKSTNRGAGETVLCIGCEEVWLIARERYRRLNPVYIMLRVQ
jgi:hypothetical protein